MTETARVYGGSLYELAQEEHLEEEILSEMKEIRALSVSYTHLTLPTT